MKRVLLILTGFCLAATCLYARPSIPVAAPDSVMTARLDSLLERYTAALVQESVEVKNSECDFIIGSVADSLTMQHVALKLFNFYKESLLMGDEAVAVHIFDTWFKPGRVKMGSDFERFEAELFADFNRSSLIGMKAPEVEMFTPCGRRVKTPEQGSHSILFFFDTGCGKCRLEAQLLPSVLEKIPFPTRFYAVYCGHDKKEWRKFRRDFKVRNRHVGVVHVWDPEVASDYLRKYGVLSTPRLFITDTDGEILGRRLEIESLNEIIYYICEYYGQAQQKNDQGR